MTPSKRSIGAPTAAGNHYRYDPAETFSPEDLAEAAWWRKQAGACPHAPPCPTEAGCLEELAWYLRHRAELHARLGWTDAFAAAEPTHG